MAKQESELIQKQNWNEFAKEYYQVQKESQITLVDQVTTYLLAQKILPTQSTVDLAGGSGRFIKTLSQQSQTYLNYDISKEMLHYAKIEALNHHLTNTNFQEGSLREFLQAKQTYSLIFSAANPALTTIESFNALRDLAVEYLVLLNPIAQFDDIFSPIEQALGVKQSYDDYATYMATLAQYLETQQIAYVQNEFNFQTSEIIPRQLLWDYFDSEKNDTKINPLLAKIANRQEIISHTQLKFQMLIVTGTGQKMN